MQVLKQTSRIHYNLIFKIDLRPLIKSSIRFPYPEYLRDLHAHRGLILAPDRGVGLDARPLRVPIRHLHPQFGRRGACNARTLPERRRGPRDQGQGKVICFWGLRILDLAGLYRE